MKKWLYLVVLALALLTLECWTDAERVASTIRDRDDFPRPVAEALAMLSADHLAGYADAVGAVLESFETRDEYLEDVAVADTVLVLQALARKRRIATELRASPVLPG